MRFRTTREAAHELNRPYFAVYNLIRYERITPPTKTGAGDYVWLDADVERARAALQTTAPDTEVVGT